MNRLYLLITALFTIISLREINATYRACFTEINTGKELQITGKWTGKFFIQNEGETLLEEIK